MVVLTCVNNSVASKFMEVNPKHFWWLTTTRQSKEKAWGGARQENPGI